MLDHLQDGDGSSRVGRWKTDDTLRVRGRVWRVRSVTPGHACAVVYLRCLEPLPPSTACPAAIITPFDRPRAVAGGSGGLASPAQLLAHLEATRVSQRPADGLWASLEASITLLPHQLEPALAALVHGATRMLVADDVGLGKTIQAGLLIAELTVRTSELRVLVLVPAGLRDQWHAELEDRFHIVAVDADAGWLRAVARDRPADVNPWALGGVYVASHDFVKRPDVLRPLESVAWDLLVVDEAHALGPGTDRRTAAHALAVRSRRVLLLTATPHRDDARAFQALCETGQSRAGEPLLLFERSRAVIAVSTARRAVVLGVEPSPAERRMHALLEIYTARLWRDAQLRRDRPAALVAIVLRKRALSSAASLARSLRRRIALLGQDFREDLVQAGLPFADEDPLPDEEPHEVLAAPGLSDAAGERRWLIRLAAAAEEAARAESKVERLVRLTRRIREPLLVFTEYRDTLRRLEIALRADGCRALLMHGGLGPRERAGTQREFCRTGHVLLATDAASEGLNLHVRCRVLVHYELPWSASRIEQRAGRVDRLGQTRRVHELAFVANHTAERLVLAPLLRKIVQANRTGTRPGVLHALGEVRLAGTILGEAPLEPAVPSPLPPFVEVPPASLGRDAAVEAGRLECLRRGLVRARAGQHPGRGDGPVLAAVRPTRNSTTLEPGLALVYRLSVCTALGHLHVEAFVLHVHLAAASPVFRRRSAFQRAVLVLLTAAPSKLREALARSTEVALERARTVDTKLEEAMRTREAAMLEVCGSAARQLLQPGLFDRRSIRRAEARARALDALRSAASRPRDPKGRDLEVETSLVAAVLVRPPKRKCR
ncbi:MAG TPA: DEAD/DEAH box helicase [Vicinamibacterales bacterium]|nr:DEAD/DEAH box helicase [Vicinamibacterales bacterium]